MSIMHIGALCQKLLSTKKVKNPMEHLMLMNHETKKVVNISETIKKITVIVRMTTLKKEVQYIAKLSINYFEMS